MTTVAEVADWMGRFAPLNLAEDWDNVGLLLGDRASVIENVMTCLTVTPESASEAIEAQVGLIVSHHPVLFRPTQKLTTDRPETAMLWQLARANVAIYSPHTAFDNAEDGINAGLARRLGLVDVVDLRPSKAISEFKVIVFVPASERENVMNAAFSAGAGRIGNYDECSFSTGGYGTFYGKENASPTIGKAGQRERGREWKLEMVCPGSRIDRVLTAIRSAHSYEEPAIDVIPLRERATGLGIGRVGRLPAEMPLDQFAQHVKTSLKCGPVGVVGDSSKLIRKVAIGCGAGDDFVKDATLSGADVLLTGEARFHKALEAESSGIAMVLAGHFATERPGVEDLAMRIAEAFASLNVWASRSECDPIRCIIAEC